MNNRARLSPRSRRHRRGVGYVWFCVVGLPIMLFAAALATNIGHVIYAHRQVYLASEAATLAGAWQIGSNGQVNASQASAAMQDTMTNEEQVGAISAAKVTFVLPEVTGNVVTIVVRYQVSGLLFTNLFGNFSSQTLVMSSFVCSSADTAGATHGQCVRPI